MILENLIATSAVSPSEMYGLLAQFDRPVAQWAPLVTGSDVSHRDEANLITALAFRRGFLEELHQGTPSPLLASPNLSRITDAEMRHLMIEVSSKVAWWLAVRHELHARSPDAYAALVGEFVAALCPGWERRTTTSRRPRKAVVATYGFVLPEASFPDSLTSLRSRVRFGSAQTRPLHGHPVLTLRDEANALAGFAYRNSFLEELHAGEPSEWTETPGFRRFSDSDIAHLMIECSARVAQWLYSRSAVAIQSPETWATFVLSAVPMFARGWERKRIARNRPSLGPEQRNNARAH